MNYFFSRGIFINQDDTGLKKFDAVTADDIKQIMKEIINCENKKKTYSDRILKDKLEEKSVMISRRTIAKYREEEGILDASGRKEY